jgi:hypothetical protein
MIEVKTIILERKDLSEKSKSKDITLVSFLDFPAHILENIKNNSIVLFLDKNSETKIIKNRFGDKGEKRFIRIIETIKQNNSDNNLGFGNGYFDDIIDLLKK